MSGRSRTWAVIGALAGWSAAQMPGALPRTALVSAVAGTVLALAGMHFGLLAARLAGRSHTTAPPAPLILISGIGAGVLALSLWWQSGLRAAMGMAPLGAGWIAATAAIPAAVVAAVIWIPLRRTVIAAAAGMLIVLGPTAGPAQAALPDVPDSPLVQYSLLDGRDDEARAADLVAEWVRTGGLDRQAVVIAVPTGSGWVDGAAVRGFDQRFGGSVRVLAMQYSAMPSWQAYLRSPERAGDSAIALLTEVARATADAPGASPEIHLYGQSLGATGAETARRWAHAHDLPLAGTVLAGVPGGVAGTGDDPERWVINNPSDPVVALQPSLLWRPPAHREPGHREQSRDGSANRVRPAPRPPWVPGLSLLATVVDLAGSLDVPVGYGHRYGVEQGLAAARQGVSQRSPDQPSTGPRAAS